MRLSILIPTLNEAAYLPGTIAAARARATQTEPEIIVSDCGSADGTQELARRLGDRLVVANPLPTSRAAALNTAAPLAKGEVLLCLDADTIVPAGYDRLIAMALADPAVVGGAFEFQLDGHGLALRLVEVINRIRYRIWPYYYGDQGIFVRSEAFRRVGGYAERRLLEADDFCRRLRRLGRLVLLRQYMTTSARRFLAGGTLRVLARDAWIWWLDLLYRPTERFGDAYQQENRRRGRLVVS